MSAIKHLRLTDFRSYPALDIDLEPGPVILFGQNGAGKTNLLEAVSFLSPGRGLRRAALTDIARKSAGGAAPAWGVNADITSGDEALKISVGQVPEHPRRRLLRIDGKTVSGTELAELMSLMWLTPQQDRLFTGPASDRRKFLDRFTLAYSPQQGRNVMRYEKARSERNRLLSDQIDDDYWYDALEADMAKFGARIVIARRSTADALTAKLDAASNSGFPKAALALDHDPDSDMDYSGDQDALESRLQNLLKDNRPLDRRAGRTLRGPHKADLRVTHLDKDMPAEACSTGEQKALLISLVLAQARAQADRHPILLLDEIAAHLDEHRRAVLAKELISLGTQIFLTGTDRGLFEAFEHKAQFCEVLDNQINTA